MIVGGDSSQSTTTAGGDSQAVVKNEEEDTPFKKRWKHFLTTVLYHIGKLAGDAELVTAQVNTNWESFSEAWETFSQVMQELLIRGIFSSYPTAGGHDKFATTIMETYPNTFANVSAVTAEPLKGRDIFVVSDSALQVCGKKTKDKATRMLEPLRKTLALSRTRSIWPRLREEQ